MKKKNWYRALSLADEKYVEEASPDNVVKPERKRRVLPILAACACFLLIVCNLWLFIPYNTDPPDVSQYAQSEYYELIQRLNEYTYERPKYKNRAAKLGAHLSSFFSRIFSDGDMVGAGGSAPPPSDAGSGSGAYREITDNQVDGIIEADRIKRSDTHIYYLDGDVLRIFAIEKENTREVGAYDIYRKTGYTSRNPYSATDEKWEFYLSSDCTTATVIMPYYTQTTGRRVHLLSLDVSDPENIVKRNEFFIEGSYVTSRATSGSILLLTEYVLYKGGVDFEDASTFVPEINVNGVEALLPADAIAFPDTLSSMRYTIILKLDEETLTPDGSAAYLSYSEDVYISEDHIFLTNAFREEKENEDGDDVRDVMTEISCLSYGADAFERKGSVTVRGSVKDQWSMDEYEGVLRVFTTTNTAILPAAAQNNASLYCIDLATLRTVASVVDFAPPNESVRSVRFDKEKAYVCTSIEVSDPVFFFDLSDLNNITYKDTGTIEGFSTSLINLGNGFLLGVGQKDSWSSLKLEVYEETADGVRSVDSVEMEGVDYSTNYKSYYVDRQNQLFGIGITDYRNYSSKERYRYLLFHFDGYQLVELVNVSLGNTGGRARGVYIDGYLYVFGSNEFKVEKVFADA